VPKAYETVPKKEIDRLTIIGVLQTKSHDSKWAAPMFIQPKKTGDVVCVLTDFRQQNKFINSCHFPLPKIANLLQKLGGFCWATAIDLYYGILPHTIGCVFATALLLWGGQSASLAFATDEGIMALQLLLPWFGRGGKACNLCRLQ
jgi:hypothetical protein